MTPPSFGRRGWAAGSVRSNRDSCPRYSGFRMRNRGLTEVLGGGREEGNQGGWVGGSPNGSLVPSHRLYKRNNVRFRSVVVPGSSPRPTPDPLSHRTRDPPESVEVNKTRTRHPSVPGSRVLFLPLPSLTTTSPPTSHVCDQVRCVTIFYPTTVLWVRTQRVDGGWSTR